jgi:hypothetical protein
LDPRCLKSRRSSPLERPLASQNRPVLA